MDQEAQRERSRNGIYVPLLQDSNGNSGDYDTTYDRPLPCCGFGIGWCLFITGFICPLTWYYGTCLFFAEHHRNGPRERPGLAACSIAALVNAVAAVIVLIVLIVERKGDSSVL